GRTLRQRQDHRPETGQVARQPRLVAGSRRRRRRGDPRTGGRGPGSADRQGPDRRSVAGLPTIRSRPVIRPHDALVLDLDGTLLTESGGVDPRNRAAIVAAAESGVRVMIATGRSSLSAHPILEDLGLDTPAVVFNGAGLYASRERRMLEERVL